MFSLSRLALLLGLCIGLFGSASAQSSPLDKIVAVIGDEVILESDIQNQYDYLIINGQKDNGGLRCEVFNQLLMNKLLLNKAKQDSITVSADEVNNEIERRIQYFTSNIGKDEFERIYHKSLAQFKADIRKDVEDELLIQRQRGKVSEEATITPREVKEFFKNIPQDSLGLLPAEVQLNHIVIIPPFSEKGKADAKKELEELRRRVVEKGEGFADLAKKYSDDPGSRKQGGSLGEFTPGMMVKQFDDVVYSLREGEVSEVFETEYGFHIVMLHSRKGQVVNASHILRVPFRSENGDSVAVDSLNRIRRRILADSLTFEQAAIRYSQDRTTKDCGGCIANPKNGELRIPLDVLDSEMFFKVDEMNEDEVSEPMEYRMPDGTRAFHLLYLHRKLPPHAPNLEDDYKKIYTAALQAKQSEIFEKWMLKAKENIYIDIRPTECTTALGKWLKQ